MFRHCRQPSGIAAGSPTYAGITPAGNLTLATSSVSSSSSTTPAVTSTGRITTAPTLYPHGHLLFVTHAAPARPTGPWRVRYAGLQLITAGPTDRKRDRRARPRTRRRAAHRVHGEALQHRHAKPEGWVSAPVPGPVAPSTPDGESAPTLDLSAAGPAHRLENQRPRGRPLTATTREPACQDCSCELMIDPMATSAAKRPPADRRRHRGRKALSTHPPAPVDGTSRGSLKQRAENTSAPATLVPPDAADPRKTETWDWRKAETERRHRAATTPPTLAPIDAFPDKYATADDLAAAGLDADPDATGPRSQTIRGLLGGACAGWRVRPTSVELHDALRADHPTSRQRSIATVLINEAPFEELVNAHTEGAFTWRQLTRAAQRQGSVPPLRMRLINAFATPPPRRENPRRS